MTLSVNIIGAGHLGKTIGHLLVQQKRVTIKAICNQSAESSLKAIEFIGQGEYCATISELPSADITFITTPDDIISTMGESLAENKWIKPGSVILHCSGTLTSDVLHSIKIKNCHVASVHPMRSFAKPESSLKAYQGTYCAMEGDAAALAILEPLFKSIGSSTYLIDKDKKSAYHAAAVFASNYVITLAHQASLCMLDAGVEKELGMQVITSIMQSAVSNLQHTASPKRALTGPIKRADIVTIRKHVEALSHTEQQRLYTILGQATLALTDHHPDIKDNIRNALQPVLGSG